MTEYPSWCDTDDKRKAYDDWLDVQATFALLYRSIQVQSQVEERERMTYVSNFNTEHKVDNKGNINARIDLGVIVEWPEESAEYSLRITKSGCTLDRVYKKTGSVEKE